MSLAIVLSLGSGKISEGTSHPPTSFSSPSRLGHTRLAGCHCSAEPARQDRYRVGWPSPIPDKPHLIRKGQEVGGDRARTSAGGKAADDHPRGWVR